MASLFSLVQNCALLALASSVLFVLENHFAWLAAGMRRRAVTGLVFGLIAALVVLSPIPGPFGASFDTRAGPLVLAGYLGGPVGGLIAASLAGIARADVGGAAVVGGLVSCLLYPAAGWVFFRWAKRRGRTGLTFGRLVLLTAFASAVAVPAFFIGLQFAMGAAILAGFAHIFVLQNLCGVVFLGLLTEAMSAVTRDRDLNKAAIDRSRRARAAGRIGVWKRNFRTGELEWDSVNSTVLGIEPGVRPSAEEFFGRIVHEDDRERVAAAFEAQRRAGEHFDTDFRIRTPPGEIRHLRGQADFHGGTPGDPEYALGVNVDITERMKIRGEMALQSAALDAASCGVIVTEAGGDRPIVSVNRGTLDITGFPREHFIGRNCRILNAGLEDQPGLDEVREALRTGGSCRVTIRNRRADGSLFWNRLSISPIRNADGEITHFVGIQEDITATREIEERFRSTFESVNVGCVVIDSVGRIELFNPEAERIFGYSVEEAVGQNVRLLMPQPDRDLHDGYLRRYAETGEAAIIGVGREVTGVRKNGETFPMHLGIGEVKVGSETTFIGSVTDLSEIKAMERRLLRSQRMEAVGQLTGGIAHDFNNVMATVLGSAELLRDLVGENDDARRLAETVVRAVDRGAALTERLLVFSRQQPFSPVATDAAALIDSLGDMMRRTLGEEIDLAIDHPDGLWSALSDRPQLENAVLNLVLNARDAMSGGGTLRIGTQNVTLTEADTSGQEDLETGDYVQVSVTDSGTGMAPDILEKVFEPFFTTKPVGKGSGLGLSMVYGFAKQSKGHIAIDSAPGRGTTVKLYLPRVAGSAKVPAAAAEPSRIQRRGTGCILVVEDDPDVRAVAATVLGQAGYEIVEAIDGNEAVAALSGNRRFDLLFTDIVLPGGMNGPAIAAAAARIQPGIRVLYTSGYTDHALSRDGILDPGVVLLDKPYRRRDLLDAVRDLLVTERILLMEDDDDLRTTLATALDRAGMRVVTASGGDEGLALLKTQSFAVIVSDVVMRAGEGVETFMDIRKRFPDIPMIGMSGNPTYLNIFEKLGAVETLLKPFAPGELIAAVRRAIDRPASEAPSEAREDKARRTLPGA